MGLWTKGISFIANNTKDFTDVNGRVIPGNYSVSIDLSNLDSNLGKDLYNDGVHRIYVSHVDNTGSVNSGGYRVGFRACGQYSLNGATLISGVHHATVAANVFTYSMSAKLITEYNGKIYNCSEFGRSGLNYKDGDDFAFYVFFSRQKPMTKTKSHWLRRGQWVLRFPSYMKMFGVKTGRYLEDFHAHFFPGMVNSLRIPVNRKKLWV